MATKHFKSKKLNTLKNNPQDSQKPITILKADQNLPQQSYVNAVSAGTIRKSNKFYKHRQSVFSNYIEKQ